MYRYVILLWDRAAPNARDTVERLSQRLQSSDPEWSSALALDGLKVLHTPGAAGLSETRLLGDGAGVVFGRLFAREPVGAEGSASVDGAVGGAAVGGADLAAVVRSGGRALLERCWGRYVAVIRDPQSEEISVLRDPTGGLPALLTTFEGVHVVFSDVEDCAAAGVAPLTVNWKYLARFIAHSGLQVRETGLNEVTEILPGERVVFRGSRWERHIEWNPIETAQRHPLEDPEQAVVALRATTRACIQTWARGCRSIVHNLSGGLDSSIVLSCLRDECVDRPITCIHYFATGPYEDERQYARLMAAHAGVPLVERQLDPAAVPLRRLLDLRRSARPWFYLYEVEHGGFEAAIAAERGADGLFSGAGGDGVFFQAGAELAVTDHLFAHGFRCGFWDTAIDAARVSRKSIWPLLGAAIRRRLLRPPWNPTAMAMPLPRTIVSADVLKAAKQDPEFVHPWFTPEATRGVAPGILWHASSIHVPPAYYSAFSRDPSPERTFPLLSQPLVELCLRIATYVLIRSGRDRALARRAFAADLPDQIVRRRSKGRIDQHVRNILDLNLPFVREMLLDGHLVREGLLDRRNLEIYLNRERSPADFQYSEILQVHLCAETWLRRWLTTACEPAR